MLARVLRRLIDDSLEQRAISLLPRREYIDNRYDRQGFMYSSGRAVNASRRRSAHREEKSAAATTRSTDCVARPFYGFLYDWNGPRRRAAQPKSSHTLLPRKAATRELRSLQASGMKRISCRRPFETRSPFVTQLPHLPSTALDDCDHDPRI